MRVLRASTVYNIEVMGLHIDYIRYMHVNNVIVVCKKYYLHAVIKDLNCTETYVEVNNEGINVVSRHLDYNYGKECC